MTIERLILFLALLTGLLGAACGGGDSTPAPAPGEAAGRGLVRVGDFQDPLRPNYHDFGDVASGTLLETTFEYANRTGAPLQILRLATSCACTVPGLRAVLPDGSVIDGDPFAPHSLLTVPPDAVLSVTLRVDPEGVQEANRDKLVTVRVTTDSDLVPYLGLEAHLKVVEHFQVAPDVADFGRIASGIGDTLEITLKRLSPELRQVTEVLETPEGVVASLGPHPTAPEGTWIVAVRVEAGLPESAVKGDVRIGTREVDGSDGPPLRIPVRARIVPDIGPSPPILSLRPVDDGVGHSIQLRAFDPTRVFSVLETEVEGDLRDWLDVSAEPLDLDDQGRSGTWTITLSGPAAPTERPLPTGYVRVRLDDDDFSRLEIPISTVALR